MSRVYRTPLKDRVTAALRDGPKSCPVLAAELCCDRAHLENALGRYEKKGAVKRCGWEKGRANYHRTLWGLTEGGNCDEVLSS